MPQDGSTEDLDLSKVAGMIQIAKYHREHERFYAMQELELAADLRKDSNALKVLADGWLKAASEPIRDRSQREHSELRTAGCKDLSDLTAVATTGILFMEGEGEPIEFPRLKTKLAAASESLRQTSDQLKVHMDAAWEREVALLTAEFADAAYHRFEILTRTTLAGQKKEVAGRLIATANTALGSQDFSPETVRADLTGAAKLVRTASWLLDMAVEVLSNQAGEYGLLDPNWTAYVEELERISASPSQACQTATHEKRENPGAKDGS